MRLTLPILLVVVLTGCLEKPVPWTPDGSGKAECGMRSDACGADGRAELVTGVSEVVPDLDAMVESDVPPDEDVPEVVPAPSLLRGPRICPGACGAWQGKACQVTIGWHRITLMTEGAE